MALFASLVGDLFDSMERGYQRLHTSGTRATGSTKDLIDALEEEGSVTDQVTKSKAGLVSASKGLIVTVATVAEAVVEASNDIRNQAKLLVRGSNLLSNDSNEQEKNIAMLSVSGNKYREITGASLTDSMTMVRNYQSAYKTVNGEFDGEGDKFLANLGNVTRVMGSSVEEMYAVQEKVLVKGKLGKEFSESVSAMMIDASKNYNLNARESLEALDDTLSNSLHLDMEGRKKNVKLALEGAALSKQAAVDFGKYATSLTGASGIDALKGVTFISALTGESLGSIDEKRRKYAETKGKDTRYLDTQYNAAGAANMANGGSGDLQTDYDSAYNDHTDEGATRLLLLEQMFKKLAAAGGIDGDVKNMVEFHRVKNEVRDQDPKLDDKFNPDEVAKHAKEIATTTEMTEMAKAKLTIPKLPEWIQAIVDAVAVVKGWAAALGLTTGMLASTTLALVEFTAKLLLGSGNGIVGGAGGAGGIVAAITSLAIPIIGILSLINENFNSDSQDAHRKEGYEYQKNKATGNGGIWEDTKYAVGGAMPWNWGKAVTRIEGKMDYTRDAADAASKNTSDAALQLLMMQREIKNTAYTADEWKNLDSNTKHQFLQDIKDGKVTSGNVGSSTSKNTSQIEPDEARMSIVGQPIQRAQVVPVADNTKSTAANDDTLKAGNTLAEQQLVVQKDMLKALRDDGAFTRFAVL